VQIKIHLYFICYTTYTSQYAITKECTNNSEKSFFAFIQNKNCGFKYGRFVFSVACASRARKHITGSIMKATQVSWLTGTNHTAVDTKCSTVCT
jgi:hypothetical protein